MKSRIIDKDEYPINRHAVHLAAQLNRAEDPEPILRQAMLDAIIHHDWNRVSGLEWSIKDVGFRAKVREIYGTAGRGILVSRKDPHPLAAKIPEGFEFGIAWIVTCVFMRTDGDFNSGAICAENFWEDHRDIYPDIDWSPHPLVVTHTGFGSIAIHRITMPAFADDPSILFQIQEICEDNVIKSSQFAEHGMADPINFMMWGCYVTGTNNPDELLDPNVWAPGLDIDAASNTVTQAFAQSCQSVGGDTYVHPRLLPSKEAYDFGTWHQREQSLNVVLSEYFVSQPAVGVVAILEQQIEPFADQLSISLWTDYGMCRFNMRFPRSGATLEQDAQRLVDMLLASGVKSAQIVRPAQPRNVRQIPGLIVNDRGEWIDGEAARLGSASLFIKQLAWTAPTIPSVIENSFRKMPLPLMLNAINVNTCIAGHYQNPVWAAIKEKWTRPCDPQSAIWQAMTECCPQASDLSSKLFVFDKEFIEPPRVLALAAQFKMAGGVCALVTPALQHQFDNTDIGDDFPATLLRPPYDVTYFQLNRRCHWLEDGSECEVEGMQVQRIETEEGVRLLIDAFLCERNEFTGAPMPLTAITLELPLADGAVLADLHSTAAGISDTHAQVLAVLAPILVYVNSKNARTVDRPDRDAAVAAIKSVQSKKEKQRQEHRLSSAFNHVVVGPEEGNLPPPGIITGRVVKPHYRRGFVRTNQRVGPGRTMTRPVFIPPVLVNAKRLAGETLPPKKNILVK